MAVKRFVGIDGDLSEPTNYDPVGLPAAADDLIFPAGGSPVTANLSALAAIDLADVFVEPGMSALGGILEYVGLNCDRLFFNGSAASYIDFAASAPAEIKIKNTASAGTGTFGLYLAASSAIAECSIENGSVSLGTSHAYDFIATALGIGGSAAVELGHDSTATTLHLHASATLTNYGKISGTQYCQGGVYYIETEQAQTGTFKLSGSCHVYHNGAGTAGGTVYLYSDACVWDGTGAPGVSRSCNWCQVQRGQFIWGEDYTVSNFSVSSLGVGPQRMTGSIVGDS